MLGDYAKTLGDVSFLRANKGCFDHGAEVTVFPRSLSTYIFSTIFSAFFVIKAFALYSR